MKDLAVLHVVELPADCTYAHPSARKYLHRWAHMERAKLRARHGRKNYQVYVRRFQRNDRHLWRMVVRVPIDEISQPQP